VSIYSKIKISLADSIRVFSVDEHGNASFRRDQGSNEALGLQDEQRVVDGDGETGHAANTEAAPLVEDEAATIKKKKKKKSAILDQVIYLADRSRQLAQLTLRAVRP
jgi:hypothetical protein